MKGIYVILTRNSPESDKVEALGLDGQTYPEVGLTRFVNETSFTGTIGDLVNYMIRAKADSLNASYTTSEEALAGQIDKLSKSDIKVHLGTNGTYQSEGHALTAPINTAFSSLYKKTVARGPQQSGEYKTLEMALQNSLGGGAQYSK